MLRRWQDFFYVCRGHLKDRTFATPDTPVDDADAKAKKREEELQREIEAIKKEYAEKQAKKKDKSKDKDKTKEQKKEEEKDDKEQEKEKDDKVGHQRMCSFEMRQFIDLIVQIQAVKDKADSSSAEASELPRIWSLHR